MIMRDNNGKIVGQIEHLRDAQGNTVDTVTSLFQRAAGGAADHGSRHAGARREPDDPERQAAALRRAVGNGSR